MADGADWPKILEEMEAELDAALDADALYALHDNLGDLRGKVQRRISDIENRRDDWTAHRDCITGALCRSRE